MEFFPGFKWAVPVAFSDAASLCNFEEGDILYSTRKAYGHEWASARKHIKHSIQVRFPARTTASAANKRGDAFSHNWSSELRLDIYTDHEKTNIGQIETTQGRLYTALWKGDLSVMDKESEAPSIPINVRQVTRLLNETKNEAIELGADYHVFVMALDRSNQTYSAKYSNIYAVLKRYLVDKPSTLSPQKAGINAWGRVAPTIEIAFFKTNINDKERLAKLIKDVVYIPSKNSKSDKFRISAHGAIF